MAALLQRLRPHARTCLHWSFRAGIAGGVLFAVAWCILPFPVEDYRRYDASNCITDRNGVILRTTLNPAGQRCLPIRLDEAGEWLPAAMIAAEDKRYHRHHGLDYLALGRALWQMVRHREVVSGASTLTTQTIRLVRPRPRNLLSKGVEAFRALQMETLFTKKEILEQYLNRSPFGGNLVGIRAASLHYFSKEPAHLSLEEAALLAGLPQSPNRLRPDRHPESARTRRNHVLERMHAAGFIGLQEHDAASSSPVDLQPWTPPFLAPHFVDAVLHRPEDLTLAQPAESTPSFQTTTTLDWTLQQLAEAQLAGHPSEKARSAAVVVLDAPTGEVLAMIGSPDYANPRDAGQFNAALSPRSPGSALNPFAYALAFDRGQLTPEEVLRDLPLQLPGYQPDNFDQAFRQKTTARKALVESLNLPAIEVVRRVGQSPFLELLRDLGLSTLDKPPGHYGLNLVLGGGEVRLLDLARAYAKLAQVRPGDPLSPEAVWMTSHILSGRERDLALFGTKDLGKRPRIAWKTGTSARGRDAWTLAWNGQYVVGVWRGNPDGSPCPGLTGITDAAPLALELFGSLPGVQGLPRTPGNLLMLEQREACARTGLPRSKACKVAVTDWHLPGISHSTPCNGRCHSEETGRQSPEDQPEILRPVHGQTFALPASHTSPTLPLEASGREELYWFVNGAFFAKARPEDVLRLPLRPGTFEITCTTGAGLADAATIVVEP